MNKTCLLVGNARPTLAAAESLKKAGYHVIVGLRGTECRADLSRHVDEAWEARSAGEGREALLEQLRERPEVEFLFPVCEEDVVWFSERRESLPPTVKLIAAEHEHVKTCLNKAAMFEVAKRAGVPTARWLEVSDWISLIVGGDQVGYPCVVKPRNGRLLGEKALICRTQAELRGALPAWPEGHTRLIIQRQATGRRHNVYFAARHGEVVCQLAVETIRTHRPNGTGLAVEGVTIEAEPWVTELTARLVRQLGYHGVGTAQFLVDSETGSVCFLEINPRLGANWAVAYRAGMDLPMAAVSLANGAKLRFDASDLRIGMRYSWMYGEASGFVRALMARQLTFRGALGWGARASRSLCRADFDLVWSWGDPMPSVGIAGTALGECARFAVGRRESEQPA